MRSRHSRIHRSVIAKHKLIRRCKCEWQSYTTCNLSQACISGVFVDIFRISFVMTGTVDARKPRKIASVRASGNEAPNQVLYLLARDGFKVTFSFARCNRETRSRTWMDSRNYSPVFGIRADLGNPLFYTRIREWANKWNSLTRRRRNPCNMYQRLSYI